MIANIADFFSCSYVYAYYILLSFIFLLFPPFTVLVNFSSCYFLFLVTWKLYIIFLFKFWHLFKTTYLICIHQWHIYWESPCKKARFSTPPYLPDFTEATTFASTIQTLHFIGLIAHCWLIYTNASHFLSLFINFFIWLMYFK